MKRDIATHRTQDPTAFAAGVLLAEEEHEQKDYQLHQLLVAQIQFQCQLEHGEGPVCAGRPANLSKVGFGGYGEPGVAVGNLCHLTTRGSAAPGITPPSASSRVAWRRVPNFEMPNAELTGAEPVSSAERPS